MKRELFEKWENEYTGNTSNFDLQFPVKVQGPNAIVHFETSELADAWIASAKSHRKKKGLKV